MATAARATVITETATVAADEALVVVGVAVVPGVAVVTGVPDGAGVGVGVGAAVGLHPDKTKVFLLVFW